MCSTTTGQLADFTLSFLHPSFHNQQQKQPNNTVARACTSLVSVMLMMIIDCTKILSCKLLKFCFNRELVVYITGIYSYWCSVSFKLGLLLTFN